jgi:transcriptional regulator with PAS, ATPase and Fis domain
VRLNSVQQAKLRRVATARQRRDEAERELTAALTAALAADVPKARVAATLGVSDMTLWRWLNGREGSDRLAASA